MIIQTHLIINNINDKIVLITDTAIKNFNNCNIYLFTRVQSK